MRLCHLHDVLQVAIGWTDSYVHQFENAGKIWGVPETDDYDIGLLDESRVTSPVRSAAAEKSQFLTRNR